MMDSYVRQAHICKHSLYMQVLLAPLNRYFIFMLLSLHNFPTQTNSIIALAMY